MKIVYFGRLGRLKEGFKKLGHEVFVLQLEEGKTLSQQIEELCSHPDLVVLEFFSDFIIPKEIHACKFPIAAYFIDAPLNSFWQIPLSYLFDYIFVDQLSSQKEFTAKGSKAVWLPLCACESDFRDGYLVEKKFFCSFVGTVNEERVKRYNLLEYTKSHMVINQFSSVTGEQMLDIFSQSHVILNENLFNGLTLRVFQGLAAGCLVLTEKISLGSEYFFEEGKHIAYYEPSTLLSTLEDIKEHPEYWDSVALAGQKECREKHMSVHRAQALLAHIQNSSSYFLPKSSGEEAQLYEAEANHMFCLRFGGSHYDSLVKCVGFVASENDRLRVKAKYFFARESISRSGDLEKAIELLESEVVSQVSLHAFLLLAQIYHREEKYEKVLDTVGRVISFLPKDSSKLDLLLDETISIVQSSKNHEFISAKVLLLFSRCYAELECIDQVGFIPRIPNIFYENATSLAIEAWKVQPLSAILDALFVYAPKANYYEGELLPYFLEGINRALASPLQIIKTAEIALSYYQREVSKSIIEGLREPQK